MSARCPVPGCAGTQQTGKLMCRECWYRVPAKTRRLVNKTWRTYKAEKTLANLLLYRRAYETAVVFATPRLCRSR